MMMLAGKSQMLGIGSGRIKRRQARRRRRRRGSKQMQTVRGARHEPVSLAVWPLGTSIALAQAAPSRKASTTGQNQHYPQVGR